MYLIEIFWRNKMGYEMLLDDLLEILSKNGIDISKLNLIEEPDIDDFIFPSHNTTTTMQIFENKKPVTSYELNYRFFLF